MYSLYHNLYSKFFEHLGSDDLDKVKRFFSDQVSQLLKLNVCTYWICIAMYDLRKNILCMCIHTVLCNYSMLCDQPSEKDEK